jgi:hypothetical protein
MSGPDEEPDPNEPRGLVRAYWLLKWILVNIKHSGDHRPSQLAMTLALPPSPNQSIKEWQDLVMELFVNVVVARNVGIPDPDAMPYRARVDMYCAIQVVRIEHRSQSATQQTLFAEFSIREHDKQERA